MIATSKIEKLIEEHIQGTGIFLVDVAVSAGNLIRVQVDRPEGISIDECVQISRFVNDKMDREVEDYALEVSSPGLGSPFKVKQQYEKNRGRAIDVLLTDGTRMQHNLKSVSDGGIILEGKDGDKEIGFEEIKTAKTIISFN